MSYAFRKSVRLFFKPGQAPYNVTSECKVQISIEKNNINVLEIEDITTGIKTTEEAERVSIFVCLGVARAIKRQIGDMDVQRAETDSIINGTGIGTVSITLHGTRKQRPTATLPALSFTDWQSAQEAVRHELHAILELIQANTPADRPAEPRHTQSTNFGEWLQDGLTMS